MKFVLIAVVALATFTTCTEASAWWRQYRSPYRIYRYDGTQVWGLPRYGYWGPRWQRDPWWNYNLWRQGW